MVELGLDRGGVFGTLRQRAPPLEARLGAPPDPPIGVAQMIVERGVAGLKRDRVFKHLKRACIIPQPVMRPAQTIYHRPGRRPQFDRVPEGALGFGQASEIVERGAASGMGLGEHWVERQRPIVGSDCARPR